MHLIVSETSFNISVLASGSTGNSLYIETDKRKVLVDAGLSGKKITSLLSSIDRSPEDLDAILVTHEHRDHIHGVGVLARKYHLDIYANELTWQAMENAIAPQFYRFYKDNKSFVVLTDTGYCSEQVKGVIKNADAYLLESNHDPNMLRMGRYPWNTKQRILGDKGHLSNEDGALAATEIIGDRTKHIYLGHLSKENNMKELANMTVTGILQQHNIDAGGQVKIMDTDPDKACDLFAI